MSIANEISRLQTAKADIKSAIEAKGVSVPSSASISTYDDYVSQISGGGGSEDLKQLIQRTITSIDIPSGTTTIGSNAFYSCISLTSVTIPDSVTSIGDYAFYSCSALTSITIPSSVTSIGINAFRSCRSLTSITIPSGVTSIGTNAFNYCSGLTSVTVEATTPPTLGGAGVFNNTNECPIYVPASSLNAYKTATGWSTYASRIQAMP